MDFRFFNFGYSRNYERLFGISKSVICKVYYKLYTLLNKGNYQKYIVFLEEGNCRIIDTSH